MSHDFTRDLLIAYSLLPFLTPSRTRLLREHFVPLDRACNASSSVLESLLRLPPDQVEQVKNPLTPAVLQRVETMRASVVTLEDPGYPAALKEIADPPLVLHLRGDADVLSTTMIAVVGSRRATPYAVNAARHIAGQLASSGLTVVSGLARGVDAAAHEAALRAGGRTVAILGTGIDVVYPRSHTRLAAEIGKSGLLASEFPPGTPPVPANFPVRNRVISGLCRGVIVVEAGRRSGSLITARMAAEQGREVFAVPGSIFSAGSEGTHRLIQSGAKLVHDVVDVLEELQLELFADAARPRPQPEGGAARALALLSHETPVHVDDLAARLDAPHGLIAGWLLELELGGWIRALPGSAYVRNA